MGEGRKGRGKTCPNANTANEIEDFKKRCYEKMTVRPIRLQAAGSPLQYEWP